MTKTIDMHVNGVRTSPTTIMSNPTNIIFVFAIYIAISHTITVVYICFCHVDFTGIYP